MAELTVIEIMKKENMRLKKQIEALELLLKQSQKNEQHVMRDRNRIKKLLEKYELR
jgi:hypothetical protein